MLETHLVILVVVLPLLAVPLCVLTRHSLIAWGLAQIVSLLVLIIAGRLIVLAWDGQTLIYQLGGWPPPIGIAYQLEILNAFFVFLLALVSTVMLIYAAAAC